MIDTELIGWVRFPDEASTGFDDRIPYYDVIEGQKIFLSTAKGKDKKDIQETIAELERRWNERQIKNKSVSSQKNKKSRETVYPNTAKTSPPI